MSERRVTLDTQTPFVRRAGDDSRSCVNSNQTGLNESYQELDLMTLFLQEAARIPPISEKEATEKAKDIFDGRLAQRALNCFALISSLPAQTRGEIRIFLEAEGFGPEQFNDNPDNQDIKRPKDIKGRNRLSFVEVSARYAKKKVEELHCALEKRDKQQREEEVSRIIDTEMNLVRVGLASRNRLVEGTIRLAVFLARKYRSARYILVDRCQDANEALVRTAERFDWRLGNKFSTFAGKGIWNAVQRATIGNSYDFWVPEHSHEKMVDANNLKSELTKSLGREPTVFEIVGYSNGLLSLRQLECFGRLDKVCSLNIRIPEDEEDELADLLESSDDVEAEANLEWLRLTVEDVLNGLKSPPQRRIVELRFGLVDGKQKTLEVSGKCMGVTRERARQIEAEAFKKLRAQENKDALSEFAEHDSKTEPVTIAEVLNLRPVK